MPISKKPTPSTESSKDDSTVEYFQFVKTNKKKPKPRGSKKKYPDDTLVKKSVWIRKSILDVKPNGLSYGDYVNKAIASSMN